MRGCFGKKGRDLFRAAILCILAGFASCGDGSMNGIYDMFGARPFVFVNSSAPAGGDGLSWSTAYNSLQTALNNAGDGQEIWICGTYSSGQYISTPKRISLYGGFAGNEKSRCERNPSVNPTTVSSLVINASGVTIDGYDGISGKVTVQGLSAAPVSVSLRNCDFFNLTEASAALVYCTYANLEIVDCVFSQGGTASMAGLECAVGSDVKVSRSTFTGLTFRAAHLATSSSCVINRSTIRSCSVSGQSGGAFFNDGLLLEINDSVIRDCDGNSGGAIFNGSTAQCKISGTTIDHCDAMYDGGAIFSSGTLSITGSTISNCTSGQIGGGIRAEGETYIVDSVIRDCKTGNEGGGIALTGIVPGNESAIRNTTITGNRTESIGSIGGGGIFLSDCDGAIDIEGGTVHDNSITDGLGAQVLILNNSFHRISNTVISGVLLPRTSGYILIDEQYD